MATSTKTPGTEASVAWGTATAWTTTGNAGTSDDTYDAVTLGSLAYSEWLKLTNFNFASDVNPAATVDGLSGAFEWKLDNTGIAVPPAGDPTLPTGEVALALVKAGTIQASSGPTTYPTDPTTTEGSVAFGGAAETWGGITISEALNSGFGVALRVRNTLTKSRTLSVDQVSLTLHYTDPVTGVVSRIALCGVGQ